MKGTINYYVTLFKTYYVMNTKLTLNIDQEVIEQAKLYARHKGRSLSDLVESLLKTLISDADLDQELTSKVQSLAGSISFPENFDYKKSLKENLNKKYLGND